MLAMNAIYHRRWLRGGGEMSRDEEQHRAQRRGTCPVGALNL